MSSTPTGRYRHRNQHLLLLSLLPPSPLLVVLVGLLLPVSAQRFSPAEVELIQQGFLKRFGMKSAPSLASPSLPVPNYFWDLYHSMREEESPPDAVRHFYPKELEELDDGLLLRYNLSVHQQNSTNERVSRADLKLKLQWQGEGGTLRIYEYDAEKHEVRRLLDAVAVQPRRDAFWLDLDVSKAFERRRETNTVDFLVEFDDGGFLAADPSSAQSLSSTYNLKAQSAALVLFVEEGREDEDRSRRRKRAAGGRRGRKGHHRIAAPDRDLCQRRDLYVDFKELNWQDWILAPVGYEAGHCQGTCPNPLPAHLNATNHAIVQSLVHSMNPSGVPPPCCVPTATESLSILYMDIENRIIIKNYPDMRVTACGCH